MGDQLANVISVLLVQQLHQFLSSLEFAHGLILAGQ